MIYKSYIVEQNIKSLKENIILFYGENLGLKTDLKNIIRQNEKEAEIINFLQEDIIKNEEQFFNEILNLSLFEKKKIFFVREVSEKILPIIQKLEEKMDDQKIYLFAEILDRKSKLRSHFEKSKKTGVVACYADNDISIKKIILHQLKNFKNLTTQNINLIINNSNLDRIKLNNELEKIKIFFNDKVLDTEKLEALLNIKENDNFNDLKNEAISGNKDKTNKLINETFIEKDKLLFYLSLINNRLIKLVEISNLSKDKNIEETINNLKPPIFWKEKPIILTQARKWNSNKLKKILNETYELELKLKSNSSINQNILFKKLIVDICSGANF